MQKNAKPLTPKNPEPPAPKDSEPLLPSAEMLILVYVVFVLFGFYLLYMYEPISVQRLFNWLFGRWV
jgi:hypothetical protein